MHLTRFQRQNMVVQWNLMNPQGSEWNPLHQEITNITTQPKVFSSMTHYILVHKFIPMPQAMKNSGCEISSGQAMEEARDNPSVAIGRKGKSKKEVIVEAQREKKKVHFATLMDMCHLKNAVLEPKLQRYKRQSRAPWWDIVKDDSGACVPNHCRRSHGCYCKIVSLRRTSSWCSIRVHSGRRWRMPPDCSEFQSQNVQMVGYVFHDTKWP